MGSKIDTKKNNKIDTKMYNMINQQLDNDKQNINKQYISKNIDYRPKVFILNSGGFKVWWLLGIYDSLVAQKINIQDNIFLGWSAGAIATALYLSGISGKTFSQKSLKLFENKYGNSDNILFSLSEIADIIKPLFEELLPQDSHLRCSNRLHIMYYNFPFGFETVGNFKSKSDLIDHLCMCCYIPFVTNNISGNTTLSDTFVGMSNEIIYNFVEYSDSNNVDIYRFYYYDLHTCGLLEMFRRFYYADKEKIINLYNSGVEDSNILVYKFNLEEFKNKSIHNYLSKDIYDTKKFKIRKRQKNFYIFKQLFRCLTIITAFYLLIYYIIKFIFNCLT